ncbi:unnamed protein product [Peniophora sp. CBMAI 1063]|nr:unnamed protein product [Peniophora sp. CBMAI 1063]
MLEFHTIQDRLEELELQLCDARIAVEYAVANNEPLAVQELATLQVERVELQVKQETVRASQQVQQSDLVLQELELALLERRIDCATSVINGANEAQRRLADLELKRAALLLSQHKKHVQRPTPFTFPPGSTMASTGSNDLMTRPVPSSTSEMASTPDASFDLSPPAPACLSPSLPAFPALPAQGTPRAFSPGSALSTPGAPADKPVAVRPDTRPILAVAVDEHDEDAHDTGDVERELIGEDACQPAGVARDAPKPRKGPWLSIY